MSRDIDLLYLPGGYPEKHSVTLAGASGERIRSGVYRVRWQDTGGVWRTDLPFVCHRL